MNTKVFNSNRAAVMEENFLSKISTNALPFYENQYTIDPYIALNIFESQMISRILDYVGRELKATSQCYYTISSAGHEINAALGAAFELNDMAFLHYRSGGFFFERARKLPGSTPIYDTLLSLKASTLEPIAGGRHKVWGSLPLNIPPQTSTIASHLPKAVGMAVSIAKANFLLGKNEAGKFSNSVVYCSFGDASVNHASALSAINAACWSAYQNIPTPIVFVCEDNGIGISVPTPNAWVESTYSNRAGLKYLYVEHGKIDMAYEVGLYARHWAATYKKPVFLHVKTVRPLGHAGSDVPSNYMNNNTIEFIESLDPLLISAAYIIQNKLRTNTQILEWYAQLRKQINRVANESAPSLVFTNEAQLSNCVQPPAKYYREAKPPVPQIEKNETLNIPIPMGKMINSTLKELMEQYKEIIIFGEDVAKKGGVYNVTSGLLANFGPARVFNTLLDETTILGTAIGMAHNGLLPIPEIQFLAYYQNAQDQIRGEAATLSFFSQGAYTNPMVIRIAGLAYQKGFGGHFHNDNSLCVLRDVPGIIVLTPSNPLDAHYLLKLAVDLAYRERKVVIFVEPIALYMTRDLYDKGDSLFCAHYPKDYKMLEFGECGIYDQDGNYELSIISFANGVYYSRIAVNNCTKSTRIIDLRCIHPLPKEHLKKLFLNNGKRPILIVDEQRKTGSVSEELMTFFIEYFQEQNIPMPRLERITSHDCFVPLGPCATMGMPMEKEILDKIIAISN